MDKYKRVPMSRYVEFEDELEIVERYNELLDELSAVVRGAEGVTVGTACGAAMELVAQVLFESCRDLPEHERQEFMNDAYAAWEVTLKHLAVQLRPYLPAPGTN